MNKAPQYLDLPLRDPTVPHLGDFLVGEYSKWRIDYSRQTDSKLWGNRWTVYLSPSTYHRGTPRAMGALGLTPVEVYVTESALERALRDQGFR